MLVLERHAIALIDERGIDIGLASIGKTMVTPSRAAAIAHDETIVRSVANDSGRVAAANRVGLEGIELALGRYGIVPGCVNVEPSTILEHLLVTVILAAGPET